MLFATVLCIAAVLNVPASAADITHRTDYSIALGILPVATASFVTEVAKKAYTISGSLSSAGLVDVFSRTKGQTLIAGQIEAGKFQASTYSVSYTSGKKGRQIDVQLRNGNVTSATIKPERTLPQNWVPVSKADLRAVLDPISGLIIPAGSKVCPKMLPIFDGESRMDIRLTAKGTKPFKTKGFEGEAIVCGIRFTPKSGYRKGRSDVEYLRKLQTMEIWFAKAEAMNVYAPVYARIPTKLGPVIVSATRFGG
ncbi:MAG: DUF3108 domain-containing protein [Pararhizobium sp.]|nr:DUF3108 domain-containing protein [Pararhizobium sp.]MDO9417460.1 DUF3108 domain-containing protein [Pararhizobium sp.]